MLSIKAKKSLGNKYKKLKSLSFSELENLSSEIRNVLIGTIAKNGGHLASNLGVVELTTALHYCYNSPVDKIIFDVSHQCYTHKILTGRLDKFSTIRKQGGLSGFARRNESSHDPFGAGHVGTAVSAALGFAQARDLKKQKNHVIAVIGDGSLTNGETFEGINNAGASETDITVVLNDNKWSISKNVGGIAKYLEKLSTVYFNGDDRVEFGSLFESLGFKYFGPIDGHNIKKLIETFELAKKTSGPKLIHILTKKGHGYPYSETSPDAYHFTNPFILESGKVAKDTKNLTYSKAFGKALIKLAKKDKKIVAITAAMPAGTGIDKFAALFPNRFFDVGIAEEHAVTFAAGLALSGFKPIVAIYSTFLQRAYDQILHDVALQNIPVIFAIDRAGIVGSDGPTHHGLFDLSYLRNIPNLTIMAPKDEDELQHMLFTTTRHQNGPIAIRYPRGIGVGKTFSRKFSEIKIGKAEKIYDGKDGAILAVGSMVYPALEAANELLNEGISVAVYNVRSVKPLDISMIKDAAKIGKIVTVEENILEGGFGSAVLEELEKNNISDVKVKRIGVDNFVEHGDANELRKQYNLSVENIIQSMKSLIK